MSDIELMAEHQWITHWNFLSLKLSLSNIMHSLYPSNPIHWTVLVQHHSSHKCIMK